MRIFKELSMPDWMMRHFSPGQEDQKASEIIVPTGIYTILWVLVACCGFYGTEWRYLALLVSFVVIVLAAGFIYWVLAQTDLLKKRRNDTH